MLYVGQLLHTIRSSRSKYETVKDFSYYSVSSTEPKWESCLLIEGGFGANARVTGTALSALLLQVTQWNILASVIC